MASGASAAGLAVQYCMPYAHDILAGAAHAAVTNARATDDYFHGSLPMSKARPSWRLTTAP